MAMLEARIRILTNNTQKPVFSPQQVVSCSQYSQGKDDGAYGHLSSNDNPGEGAGSLKTSIPSPLSYFFHKAFSYIYLWDGKYLRSGVQNGADYNAYLEGMELNILPVVYSEGGEMGKSND